jgi:hypothetical protein
MAIISRTKTRKMQLVGEELAGRRADAGHETRTGGEKYRRGMRVVNRWYSCVLCTHSSLFVGFVCARVRLALGTEAKLQSSGLAGLLEDTLAAVVWL